MNKRPDVTRPESLFPLFAPVSTVKGVGSKLETALARLHIARVRDLVFHLPGHFLHRVDMSNGLREGHGRLLGKVVGHHPPPRKGRPHRVEIDVAGQGLVLVFFHARGNYLETQLPVGSWRALAGKVERFGDQFQIAHPDHMKPEGEFETIPEYEPVYPLAEGITQGRLQTLVKAALPAMPDLPEWIAKTRMAQEAWPGWQAALMAVHAAGGAHPSPLSPPRLRLAYDELFSHQLAFALARAKRRRKAGRGFEINDKDKARVIATLGFPLTGAQARATDEALKDLSAPARMQRLLQGDVGSGKTAVAFIAMALVVRAGAQAALMAPTDILARQHEAGLTLWAKTLGLSIVRLSGRDSAPSRREKLAQIKNGEAHIIIGTHALFQDEVVYHDLGFAVIDEQHRFGVRDRQRLAAKGRAVDLLLMSATPIPRTLTLSIYGEMEISILDEKPPGRQKIDTLLLSETRIGELKIRVAAAIAEGRQLYWVCPLVGESEALNATAAEERYADLVATLGGERIGLVHGKMPQAERDEVMRRFADGALSVLVATTVIEVGVNIPNATIMIIEGAERFGLAQLHQLRGRVGRGAAKSTCILVYGALGETAKNRLTLLRETDDGFKIAEADLEQRGAGDVLGVAQSGLPRFRIADLDIHSPLLAKARDDARLLLHNDPEMASAQGAAARVLLHLMEREQSIAFLRVG